MILSFQKPPYYNQQKFKYFLLEKTTDLKSSLKNFFGFSSFKGLQEPVIQNILSKKNTFVVMPTGGGKSLCYQLPAIISEGTAIVVSPLIALMKNQVDAIRGISSNDGIAHVLNSSLSKKETQIVKEDLLTGITKLLYVAPESLVKKDLIDFFKKIEISFLAIDEAHCISEWGHDFRPEYRNLRQIIDKINLKIPTIALTATATPKVQDDIIKNLKISDARIFKSSFNRPNLYYEVRTKTSKVDSDIIKFIKTRVGKSGIVYCLSRKRVEELAKTLQVNGIIALPYHAGLDSKTRVRNQDMFLKENCDVIVATIAFGMGIDKPDVRFVIHHDIPKSIESYYQETGRAGRDGGEGYCLAFYSHKDIEPKWLELITQNTNSSSKETFSVAIPPPNVTGSLHLGHALNTTIQDILVKFNSLKGLEVRWTPGTDHAGIATQALVEKKLEKDNLTKNDLGREKFIEKVWE